MKMNKRLGLVMRAMLTVIVIGMLVYAIRLVVPLLVPMLILALAVVR